jgi:hypothetical protein
VRKPSRSLACIALVASAPALFALGSAPAVAAERDQPQTVAAQPQLAEVSARKAIRIADRTPEVREERGRHPGLEAANVTFFQGSGNWGITYALAGKELADVTVDGRTGEVIEAWRGIQAEWVMARGHSGYFGDTFQSWYVWVPLCLLFLAPFVDPRRPFRILHLDLLVLVGGFGVSQFFFNRGDIGTSVPLVYPVLAYFLVRMLVAGFRPRRTGQPLVPYAPAALLIVGIVLLGGFRVGLELTQGRVGDVGYASAVGATRIQDDEPLYADSGANDLHFDTYGPVNYLAYDPFVRIWKPTQQQIEAPQDYELTAARAASIAFDALTIVGLFLLGLRLRAGRAGRMLGLALAYAWVSLPYTLFPLMSNTNDSLIAALVVFALLGITSAAGRAAMIALAGAAKFAPLALAPLFAGGTGESRLRSWAWFTLTFALVGVITVLPYVPAEGGLRLMWEQTIGFQFNRESPFSVWGQNPGLDPILTVAKVAVIGLAIAVAFVPRRRDVLQIAALGAAVLIGTQFLAIHWFYLYVVWFTPFLLVALFGEYRTGHERVAGTLPGRITVPAPREREPAGAFQV